MRVMDNNRRRLFGVQASTTTPTTSTTQPKRKKWLGFLKRGENVGALSEWGRSLKNVLLNGNDEEICDFVRRNPECCQKMYPMGSSTPNQLIKSINNTNNHKNNKLVYPLFVVCGRPGLSVETIETVYEAFPDGIDQTLHHACTNLVSLEVIEFLVSKYPDGAHALDKGWLPLHSAVAGAGLINSTNNNNINNRPVQEIVDIISYLIECYPDGIHQTTLQHKLPLHLAIQHGVSIEVIKLLVSKYPMALQTMDYPVHTVKQERGWLQPVGKSFRDVWNGGLPLHLACKFRLGFPYIKYLIHEYPDALRTKNQAGFLPLHYACQVGAPIQVIESLVICCPNALLERTVDFRYPVDMTCGRPDGGDLYVLQYLLSKHPVLDQPPERLYLHYCDEASMYLASMPVIRFLNIAYMRARQGYTFVSTREDKIVAVPRDMPVEPPPAESHQKEDQQKQEQDQDTPKQTTTTTTTSTTTNPQDKHKQQQQQQKAQTEENDQEGQEQQDNDDDDDNEDYDDDDEEEEEEEEEEEDNEEEEEEEHDEEATANLLGL